MGLLIVFGVYGLIIFAAAYGISNVIYKRLDRAGNSNANTIRVVTFILSFVLLFIGIGVLFFNSFRLQR